MKTNPDISLHGRCEPGFSHRSFSLLCCLLAATLCAGCASHTTTAEAKRPAVYRGGQYYGDALHAGDLASQ